MGEIRKKRPGCCISLLLVLLLAAMLVMGLAAYGYSSVLGQIGRVDGMEATLSPEEIEAIENETDAPGEVSDEYTSVDEDELSMGNGAELIKKDANTINILLIGQDRRPGEGRTRSDTMILCTINTEKKTMVMTSFLRDLYVDIPDWNGRTYLDNRLNACYAFGGMGMLDLALKNNFGIQVDHNIEVDFESFEEIIKIFGGVNITLTKAEADYLKLKEGPNFLTPKQALAYSRIRAIDSDFGRTNRQRNVMMSLFASVRGMNTNQMTRLVRKILPMLTTDMTNGDITDYMMRILPILPELEVTAQYIPASGTYKSCYVRGMAVLVPDLEVNRAILRETLG